MFLRYCSLLALMALLTPAAMRAAAKDAPEDLLQYVREAQKLGLNDQEIKDNAVKAGWRATSVEEALAFGRSPRPKAAGADSPPATPEEPDRDRATLAASVRPSRHESDDGYRIVSGDVLQIIVWKDPDASVPSAVVRPDGKIGMPLLKEIVVAGLTPKEVERMITGRLSQFIRAADVTVVVKEINTKAYVVGAVKKEGPVSLQYQMTVLQALSEAGGVTDYAKRKKIYLLRSENGKPFRFPFNYDAVIRGQQMEQNIPVIPGDTIVVPH